MQVSVDEKVLEEFKKQFTPLNASKIVVGTLISLGATAAVIAMFKDPIKGAKGLAKILMASGVFILGCKAGDVAEDYFKNKVDEVAETVHEIKDELNKESNDNGTDSNSGRDPEQQPKKQATDCDKCKRTDCAGESSGKAPSSVIRRGWWGKKKRT